LLTVRSTTSYRAWLKRGMLLGKVVIFVALSEVSLALKPRKISDKAALSGNSVEHEEGKMLAETSSAKHKFVYGTMFYGKSANDLKLLHTQWNTWLKAPYAENRTFATTDDSFLQSDPNIIRVKTGQCSQSSLALRAYCAMCTKRADLFVEAAKRNADWLVIHHTDMFIAPKPYEKFVETNFNPDEPIVMGGSTGCGMNMVEIKDDCPEMVKLGGICGGNHYIFSRAAIANMLSDGPEALAKEYATLAGRQAPPPEDIADGCVVRRHKMDITHMHGKRHEALESSSFTLKDDEHFLLFHPIKKPELLSQIYPQCIQAGMCEGE